MKRTPVEIGLTAALLVAALSLSGSARGQGGQDIAAAEALFREGKQLMGEGRTTEACVKFEASLRLDPAIGTLLNLADCAERAGQTASAWGLFLEAATLSRRAGSERREQVARERAAALEPRLIHLSVIVPDAARVPGLTVKRDGKVVPAGAWGSGFPVDPGPHEVVVTAPGMLTWRTAVEARDEGQPVQVAVPVLKAAPVVAAPSTESAPPGVVHTPAGAEAADPGDSDGSTQRLVGLIVGGAGVIGLAVSGGFALSARSHWSAADCTNGLCRSPDDQDAAESAVAHADVATVSVIAGGALLAAGAVLWLTAPAGPNAPGEVSAAVRVAPMVGTDSGGVSVLGRF